jgi:hypothetical protein
LGEGELTGRLSYMYAFILSGCFFVVVYGIRDAVTGVWEG